MPRRCHVSQRESKKNKKIAEERWGRAVYLNSCLENGREIDVGSKRHITHIVFRPQPDTSIHHILFYRCEWEEAAKTNNSRLVVPISDDKVLVYTRSGSKAKRAARNVEKSLYTLLRKYFQIRLKDEDHLPFHLSRDDNNKYRVPVFPLDVAKYVCGVMDIRSGVNPTHPRKNIWFLIETLINYRRYFEKCQVLDECEWETLDKAITALTAQAEFLTQRGYVESPEGYSNACRVQCSP